MWQAKFIKCKLDFSEEVIKRVYNVQNDMTGVE